MNGRGGPTGSALKDNLLGPVPLSNMPLINCAGESSEDAVPSLETYVLYPQSFLLFPSSWKITVKTPHCARSTLFLPARLEE